MTTLPDGGGADAEAAGVGAAEPVPDGAAEGAAELEAAAEGATVGAVVGAAVEGAVEGIVDDAEGAVEGVPVPAGDAGQPVRTARDRVPATAATI